mmetsp:Transcript_157895/g.483883  ORF Transcript_157895/g.483883 Transcript_157895/m.483883 type:complete len:648 (+) Transcript_157895:99-2042(+)
MTVSTEEKSARLLAYVSPLSVSTRLGKNLPIAVEQAVRRFEKAWPPPGASEAILAEQLRRCGSALEVLADLHEALRAAEELYRLFLPSKVNFVREDGQAETFDLNGLDTEGRPIYHCRRGAAETAYLRWHRRKQGGVWAAHTDAEGQSPGDLHLNSSLPTDLGLWMHATGLPAHEVRCVRCDTPLLSHRDVRALDGCWASGRDIASICEDVGKVLQEIGLGELRVASGDTVYAVLQKLLRSLCSMLLRLEVGDPAPPRGATWPDVFASVESLAELCDAAVWERLSDALPAFVEGFELTWAQCTAYTCRILRLCDMCNPAETWLPRLFHRCFLRRWQQLHMRKVRMLDLSDQMESVRVPRKKQNGFLRCVAISDTLGWHGDLVLPQADVLFHCGNLLLEGSTLEAGVSAPKDLERALQILHSPLYSKFEWIFLVGGNHDRAIHELWAKDPDQLCKLLPPNLVLLQAPADLSPALPGGCLARDPEVRGVAQDGAMKLLPDLTLAAPSSREVGCVVAGSGVSLRADHAGSADSAFQLPEGKPAALEQAAEALLRHRPDIVISHGPPRRRCDLGCGDAALARALEGCGSVKVHLFGHVREACGVEFEDRCAYVNASLSTPLCVPAREPVVFDFNPRNFAVGRSCIFGCSAM